MASLERLRKNRGVVRASVTRTITLLTTNSGHGSDAAQVDRRCIPDSEERRADNLNKANLDATDDDAYDEELEAAEDYDRKVSYAVSRARFFLREHANTATARRTSRPEATLPNRRAGAAAQRMPRSLTLHLYNVVLNRVLMRCLPDDLAILYRQKSKEAAQDTSGIATPEERARQHAEMLSFLRIQIEVREEGRPGRTPSAFSRLLPEEDVEPPQHRWDICLQLTEEVAPYAAVVSTPSRTATFNSQLRKNGLGCALLVAATVAACKTTSRVFADVRAASSVVSATDDISLSSVNCHAGSPNPCKRNDSEPRRASHRRARHEHAVSDIGSKRPERNQRRSKRITGSDVYWKVATGKVDHLTSNLTAVETKFGWTSGHHGTRKKFSIYERSIPALQHEVSS
ncbi:hypothetical protein HPB52_015123 [Rhipicephalus sanguineus]|uniref:Uncharacterized protein n=1 Tax=Rhipicephalus sanguineus TaxID=34632 RepID=A0A9D4T0M3_RHISA|nr:hypothetical protein HPB52_015123 [Rhipicephalus sanguineus]